MLSINGTFIVVIFSFIVFLFIMKKILYSPILKVMEERENFYAKNSKMESESKAKSKTLIDEKESILKQTKLEASELIQEVSAEAKKQSLAKIKEAKQQTQNEIEENKHNLQNQSNEAKMAIKQEMNGLVKQIVSKILSKDIEVNLDENKINEYLKI